MLQIRRNCKTRCELPKKVTKMLQNIGFIGLLAIGYWVFVTFLSTGLHGKRDHSRIFLNVYNVFCALFQKELYMHTKIILETFY